GSASLLAGGQIGENRLGGAGLFGEHQLQMVAQRGFDGGDVAGLRHAQTVGKRAKHRMIALERGEGAAAEAFVVTTPDDVTAVLPPPP
ncbi:MAG TPA: hypothetical protein PLY51_15700, partial [Microthrixaceae bacterium]|nr:hypothetical protein [Microthrixaceae bacterium]